MPLKHVQESARRRISRSVNLVDLSDILSVFHLGHKLGAGVVNVDWTYQLGEQCGGTELSFNVNI